MSDLRVLEFQIEDARKAIDRDLADLATKSMSASERKAVRENLQVNVDALKDLKAQRERARFPLVPDLLEKALLSEIK